jgi:acetamidase/formamidase
VGNARPLDQATQHSTTEMVRWLAEDYGLDTGAASILMGQALRYEIGNVFDPAYTVVCKVAKAVLSGLDG